MFLLLGSATYLFLFSPVFEIKEIAVAGNNLISTQQINENIETLLGRKILKIIPGNISIFLSENKIKASLLNSFLEIASVQIKKPQPDKLDILISERQSAAVLCRAKIIQTPAASPVLTVSSTTATAAPKMKETLPESAGCFFVDEGGFVYRQAPQISGTFLPTFYRLGEEDVFVGGAAIEASTVQFALEIKKNLRELGIDLSGFVLNEIIFTELKAFTGEGWFIYFDTNRSALVQAAVLETLLASEVKQNRGNLEYVDLRVQNRVYYK